MPLAEYCCCAWGQESSGRPIQARPTVAPADPHFEVHAEGIEVDDIAVDIDASLNAPGAPSRGATAPPYPMDEGSEAVPLVWEELKSLADQGDLPASCKLAIRMQACRQARELRHRMQEDIDAVASGAAELDPTTETRLASNETALADHDRSCTDIPASLATEEWKYLLQAADAGHGPSMHRFLMYPPIDLRHPLDYADALVAYRDRHRLYVERLLQQGAAEGLTAGLLIASGMPILGEGTQSTRNPELALRLASALAIVRGKPGILDSTITNVADTLSPAEIDEARRKGERMARRYAFQFSEVGVATDVNDEERSCELHWTQ